MKMTFENETIDTIDWNIIVALQEDARLSMAALGREVGLSAPAAAERVKRLEQRKIIRSYRAEIDLDRVGLKVHAIVRIKAGPRDLDKATRALCAFPEVFECYRATGGDCFVLRIAVSDIKELQRFLDRIAPFGDLTTSVILSTPLRQKTVRTPVPSAPSTRKRRSVSRDKSRFSPGRPS
jgi:Lrp/AsnC family transcriptional regulator, leucine-responsive regulatory protein